MHGSFNQLGELLLSELPASGIKAAQDSEVGHLPEQVCQQHEQMHVGRLLVRCAERMLQPEASVFLYIEN